LLVNYIKIWRRVLDWIEIAASGVTSLERNGIAEAEVLMCGAVGLRWR